MKAKQKCTQPWEIPYANEMIQLQDEIIRGIGCGFVGVRNAGTNGVRLTIESEWDMGIHDLGSKHGNFAKIHLTDEAVDELIVALLASRRSRIEDRA